MSGFVVVFLLALMTPGSGARRDLSGQVFPPGTAMIFAAEVAEAAPSAWRTEASGLEERTIRVRLKVDRVFRGSGKKAAPGQTGSAEIRQSRWGPEVVWEAPGFWSHRDLRAGATYLVFASATTSAEEAFAEPLAVWELSQEPSLLQDVELVLAGAALGEEAQESQVLAAGASSAAHSVYFARYAAAVASPSKSANRKPLLAWIGRMGDRSLSERAKAELLRSFHTALAGLARPPSDALQALTAACLRTLAASEPQQRGVTPRLESVVQVYLPWLARAGTNFKSEARETLTPPERAQAAAAAAQLVTLPLPETSKKVLRDLAEALK